MSLKFIASDSINIRRNKKINITIFTESSYANCKKLYLNAVSEINRFTNTNGM